MIFVAVSVAGAATWLTAIGATTAYLTCRDWVRRSDIPSLAEHAALVEERDLWRDRFVAASSAHLSLLNRARPTALVRGLR